MVAPAGQHPTAAAGVRLLRNPRRCRWNRQIEHTQTAPLRAGEGPSNDAGYFFVVFLAPVPGTSPSMAS